MAKKTIVIIVSIVGITVLLLSSLVVVMKNGYKADTIVNRADSTVNYKAKVAIYSPYTPKADENGLTPVSGGQVLLRCPDDSLPGTKEFSGFSDDNGIVSIPISNPTVCMYQIYAGYFHNWSQYGSVSLIRYLEYPPSDMMNLPVFEVDWDTDMMKSNYPGLDGFYRQGYQGGYRLSNSDEYYVRQHISLGKLTDGIAPTGAKIKLAIENVSDLFCMPEWEPGREPGWVDPQKFYMTIYVDAVNSDWRGVKGRNSKGPTLIGAGEKGVGSKEIEINCQNYQTLKEIEIDVDYSNIPKEHRYYSYVNGFRLSAMVLSSDPAYPGNSYPFFVLRRDEDTGLAAATIEYIGGEKFKIEKPGFQGAIVNPVGNGASITSDFGWRGLKESICHRGIDYDTEEDTPLYAAADGIVHVVHPKEDEVYGIYLIIKHCNQMYTFYGHLNYGGIKVKLGEKVKAGQLIGLADSTGSSTGHHLHFSVGWKSWDNYYDPLLFFMDVSSGKIDVNDWPGRPKRNKGKDPEQRKEWLKKDPCMGRGWHYEI